MASLYILVISILVRPALAYYSDCEWSWYSNVHEERVVEIFNELFPQFKIANPSEELSKCSGDGDAIFSRYYPCHKFANNDRYIVSYFCSISGRYEHLEIRFDGSTATTGAFSERLRSWGIEAGVAYKTTETPVEKFESIFQLSRHKIPNCPNTTLARLPIQTKIENSQVYAKLPVVCQLGPLQLVTSVEVVGIRVVATSNTYSTPNQYLLALAREQTVDHFHQQTPNFLMLALLVLLNVIGMY